MKNVILCNPLIINCLQNRPLSIKQAKSTQIALFLKNRIRFEKMLIFEFYNSLIINDVGVLFFNDLRKPHFSAFLKIGLRKYFLG